MTSDLTANQRVAADVLDPQADEAIMRLARYAGPLPTSVADLDLARARFEAGERVLAEAVAWRRADPSPTSLWEGHADFELRSAVDALISLLPGELPDSTREGAFDAPRQPQRPDAASSSQLLALDSAGSGQIADRRPQVGSAGGCLGRMMEALALLVDDLEEAAGQGVGLIRAADLAQVVRRIRDGWSPERIREEMTGTGQREEETQR